MGTFVGSLALALVLAGWLGFEAPRARLKPRAAPRRLVAGAWALYLLYTFLVAYAAWESLWLLPLPATLVIPTGSILAVAGVALHAAGLRALGSWRRISGLALDRLMTGGVYRWSRNPQMLGWVLVLWGFSLLGRSGVALLLALGACGITAGVVRAEERRLDQVFGDAYWRYRLRTPRYLGLPRSET